MSKKNKKFRDIWVNQSRLGEEFKRNICEMGQNEKYKNKRAAEQWMWFV